MNRTEKIEEIEHRLAFSAILNEQEGMLDTALNALGTLFSDRGLIGAFTDIITKDRGAKQYSSDPIAQRIYKQAQKAVSSNKISELNKSIEMIEYYIDNYTFNFRKLINNPDVIRQVTGRKEGYAWYPEYVIGTPTKIISQIMNIGLSGYEQFPQPYEFVDSVIQAVEALVYAAITIIARLMPKIINKEKLALKVASEIDNFLVGIYNIEKKSFRVRATFKRRQDRGYEFNLSELIEKVNNGTNNGIGVLVGISNSIKSGDIAKSLEGDVQDQSEETSDRSSKQKRQPKIQERSKPMKKETDKYKLDMDDVKIDLNEVIESVIQKLLEESELDEASSVGSIAGYSLPLGTSNQKDPDKEMEDTVEKSGYKELVPDPHSKASNISPQYQDSFKKGSDFYFKGRKSDSK